MVDSQVLELYIGADQAPYWDIYTTPAHTADQTMTGWSTQLEIRRVTDDSIVLAKTGTVGNGNSTDTRVTIAIAAADITFPEGRNYYGSLWRTGSGTKYPLWSGPVRLIKPAATS